MGRDGHVQLSGVEIGEFIKTQSGLVTLNAFGRLIPIPCPQCPLHQIGMFGHRKQGEPVNPTILANPIPDLHVVGMGVLSEAGGFRLLRREEALLGLCDLERSPLRVVRRPAKLAKLLAEWPSGRPRPGRASPPNSSRSTRALTKMRAWWMKSRNCRRW